MKVILFTITAVLVFLRDYYVHNRVFNIISTQIIRILYKLILLMGLREEFSKFLIKNYNYFLKLVERLEGPKVVGVSSSDLELSAP